MDDDKLIFVYGTLKKGFFNHEKFLPRCKFIGQAITLDRFDMIDVGFPVLLPQQKARAYRVLGEVYKVAPPQLQRLDQLEGNGRMYVRQERSVNVLGPVSKILIVDIYIGLTGRWSEVQSVEPKYLNTELEDVYDWQYQEDKWRKRNQIPR